MFHRPPPKTATPMPQNAKDLTVTDTFDIYVDAVTNIPDNATIVKVLSVQCFHVFLSLSFKQ